MHRIVKVALREYLETVKSKMFVVSVLFTPLLIIVMLLLVGRASVSVLSHPRAVKKVAVTDLSNALNDELHVVFNAYNQAHPQRQITLASQPPDLSAPDTPVQARLADIRTRRLDAYVLLSKNALTDGRARCYTLARNIEDFDFFATVQRLVNDAATHVRLREHDLSPKLIAKLQRPVPLEQIDVSAPEQAVKKEMSLMFMVPFFFLFLMFMGVFGMNQQMLTSVIEEKSSRVMEILLSALTPFELMAGKILGLSVVGFTLVSVWGITAFVTALVKGMPALVSSAMMGYFFVYFVLGFLLISSMLAAVGSVCNTVKEAQALMTPLSIVLVLPMVGWFFVARNLDGTLATVLSFFPPLTPMIMVLRLAANPYLSPVQIVATIALLAVSVPAVMFASAKIFHIGILMYGKPPKLREMLRWLRA